MTRQVGGTPRAISSALWLSGALALPTHASGQSPAFHAPAYSASAYSAPPECPDRAAWLEALRQRLANRPAEALLARALQVGSFPDGSNALGDIDGDGFDDFMLRDVHVPISIDPLHPTEPYRTTLSVFYGRSERFESGTSWAAADARLRARSLIPIPNGDVTGDGRADVLLSSDAFFWLPGSAERLSGDIEATSALQEVVCTPACAGVPIAPAGDVDGDGVGDLLAFQSTTQASLFYGGPGLLDVGIDFTQAAATFDHGAALPYHHQPLMAAGDRDGDGDSDLFAHFYSDPDFARTDVAFAGGSAERLSGAITLPVQDVLDAHPNGAALNDDPSRAIQKMYVAGDLDGDGSSDMISLSSIFNPVAGGEPGQFDLLLPRIHIHYGTPGASPSPVR